MRTKTSNWFVCKVNYERQRENGLFAKVNEMYVLEAVSWADAEETITKELQSLLSGEFVIKDISVAPYSYSIIRVIETKVMDVFECNTKNTDEQ